MWKLPQLGSAGKATRTLTGLIVVLILSFNVILIVYGKTNSRRLPVMPVVVIDFAENAPFIIFLLIFGAIGSYVKVLINRYLKAQSTTTNQLMRMVERESELIIVGAWLGVVGYFALESKLLLRILYSNVNYDQAEIHFVPLAFVAMLFGYFALELVEAATRQLQKRFKLADESEAASNRDVGEG